ncbi:MAG: hypothetical protein ACREFK_10025 [Stellaceae bacterium]
MPINLGTRTKQTLHFKRIDQGSATRSRNQDLGMTKLVVAAITFGGGNAAGANGTFANTFALNDPVLIEGANLNNGFFTVTALDTINNAFLTLDPPPKAEGPIAVTLRTP